MKQRMDKVKGSMYLTHLALLTTRKGGLVRYQRYKHPDTNVNFTSWMTASHLCGKRHCFNPKHLILEPHLVNVSRIKCCSDICKHTEKCIRTKGAIQEEIKNLEKKFSKKQT